MKKGSLKRLIGTAVISLLTITEAIASDMQYLNAKQESIIAISAHTALGNINKLIPALNTGLDAGLSVNEIKEIMIQLYAYAGFPRSLNGINTFMCVLDDRASKGIKDEIGKDPSPVPPNFNRDEYGAKTRAQLGGRKIIPEPSGYQLFAPAIDNFLKEHLFADIFVRDNFDHQSRELETIAILASLGGLEDQLRFHMNAAINTGMTESELSEFIKVIAEQTGQEKAEATQKVLDEILAKRAMSSPKN